MCGPGSSVGIAGRSGDRIPVGWDFLPIQTGPGAHPASCTIGTGSFLGVRYGQGVLLTTHPLLVLWSWKSRAICTSTHPLGHNWACNGDTLPFTDFYLLCILFWPPLWASGQSFWLQIQRSRVRFPALPDFLSSSGSGTGSTQPREVNWGATWIKKSSGSGPENRD